MPPGKTPLGSYHHPFTDGDDSFPQAPFSWKSVPQQKWGVGGGGGGGVGREKENWCHCYDKVLWKKKSVNNIKCLAIELLHFFKLWSDASFARCFIVSFVPIV